MAKKVFVIACALLFIANLSVFSQQNTDEKMQLIDLQIEKYTRQRNLGIGLCVGGAALEVLGAILAYSSLFSADYYYDPDFDSSLLWGSVIMLAGGIPVGFGTFMWISGAIAIHRWESRKFDISLGLRGPDLSSGRRLGEVSLVCSY